MNVKYLDPIHFGLQSRTVLREVTSDSLAIVINRKSRIIMADGRKILDKAEKIRQARPDCTVLLQTTAPVCSKTEQFLADHGIEVVIVNG